MLSILDKKLPNLELPNLELPNLELPNLDIDLPILERLFNLDELIEKNAQQKKNEISAKIQDFCDHLNRCFKHNVTFKISNPNDDLCEGEIPLFTEPLVIYCEFEHEVVLQLKSSDTQEDTSDSDNYCTIFGVFILFRSGILEIILNTKKGLRHVIKPVSGIATYAYENFLEDPEAFNNLVEVIRGILDSRIH